MATEVVNSRSVWLYELSSDIRFTIYDVMMAQEHNIMLGKIADRGPLVSIISVSLVLRDEVEEWFQKINIKQSLILSRLLGIYNPETTTFHLGLTRERIGLFRSVHGSLIPQIQCLCLSIDMFHDKEFLRSDLFDCQLFDSRTSERFPGWQNLKTVKIVVADDMWLHSHWIFNFMHRYQSLRGRDPSQRHELEVAIVTSSGRILFDAIFRPGFHPRI